MCWCPAFTLFQSGAAMNSNRLMSEGWKRYSFMVYVAGWRTIYVAGIPYTLMQPTHSVILIAKNSGCSDQHSIVVYLASRVCYLSLREWARLGVPETFCASCILCSWWRLVTHQTNTHFRSSSDASRYTITWAASRGNQNLCFSHVTLSVMAARVTALANYWMKHGLSILIIASLSEAGN
jgi:hypothetical protein